MCKQKTWATDISPDTNYSPKLKIHNAYIFCLQHRITNATHRSVGTNSHHNSSCSTSNNYCTLAIKICWNLFIANKFLQSYKALKRVQQQKKKFSNNYNSRGGEI